MEDLVFEPLLWTPRLILAINLWVHFKWASNKDSCMIDEGLATLPLDGEDMLFQPYSWLHTPFYSFHWEFWLYSHFTRIWMLTSKRKTFFLR